MVLYHGSDHIIEVPVYNGSKRTNDYGYGFYTTESIELAKEWACADNRDGFANCYECYVRNLMVTCVWSSVHRKFRGWEE